MIKVIGKNGNIAKTVTCRHCSAILEYLPIDVTKITYTDISGTNDIHCTIKCPECNTEIVVH